MTSFLDIPEARLATIVLAASILLAGCTGAPADGPTDADPQAVEPQPSPDETDGGDQREADANRTSEDANATRPAGEDEQAEPGPRTISHAEGETTIEGATERVVALEFNHVENLLALDLQPAGVAEPDGYEKWVGAGELSPDVVDVGTRAEPSLETIADLEPDLILAIEFRHEDIYDELSAIAPTLVFEGFPDEERVDQFDRMRSIVERTAVATAREDEGQAVLDEMDAHFDEVQARLDEAGQTDREVLLSQLFTHNGQPLARVFLGPSIVANVAERIGLENAWVKKACSTGYGYCDVSKEGFADVDHADFLYQAQPDDDPVQDHWSDDPVWNSYEFVREDRVYPLGADAWMFGGPLMSQELADRIAEHLLG